MAARRVIAIIAFLIGAVGVILILRTLALPGSQDFLDWLRDIAILSILGLVALLGCVLIAGHEPQYGGIVNIVVGFILLILGRSLIGSLLVLFSGLLGLVIAGTFDESRYHRH